MKIINKYLAFIMLFYFIANYSCKNKVPSITLSEITNSSIDFNVRDTIVNWYHPNGKIKRSSQFLNGEIFGTTNTFGDDGKPKNCFFFNEEKELLYLADYSKDGAFLKSKGKAAYFLFFRPLDSLKVNEEYEFGVFAPKLPIGQVSISFGVENKEGIEILEVHQVENRGVLFQHTFVTSGNKKIPIIVEMIHSPSVVEKDTTWIEFYVM